MAQKSACKVPQKPDTKSAQVYRIANLHLPRIGLVTETVVQPEGLSRIRDEVGGLELGGEAHAAVVVGVPRVEEGDALRDVDAHAERGHPPRLHHASEVLFTVLQGGNSIDFLLARESAPVLSLVSN